jgi:hypothetical protein
MTKMDKHYISLVEKLALLSAVERVELTPEEALLYGVAYSDNINEIMEGEENEQ